MTHPGDHTPAPASSPSADLAAANERLLALRARHQARPVRPTPLPHRARTRNLAEIYECLPPHLGWESAAVSTSLRGRGSESAPSANRPDSRPESDTAVSPSPQEATVSLQPTLALAILKQGKVSAGQLWFLMHHLDEAG